MKEQLYPIGTKVFISDESGYKYQQKFDEDGEMVVGVVKEYSKFDEGWMEVKFNTYANSYKMRDLILADPNQEVNMDPQYEVY